MALVAKSAPPNSVVLLSDAMGGEIPPTMHGKTISATDSCVAVGCMAEDDGETEFTLGTLSELERPEPPAYQGVLKTPSRRVVLRSVLGGELLSLRVNGDVTRVTIWTNDISEPDHVVVAVR
ncbi:MAG: hypothetical protein ACREA9_02720 [Pyrinomonadaceae bacterium]